MGLNRVAKGLPFEDAIAVLPPDALALNEPLIYMTLGVAWGFGLLARFYSMMVDKTSLKQSLPGIIVDGVMAALFLSGMFL